MEECTYIGERVESSLGGFVAWLELLVVRRGQSSSRCESSRQFCVGEALSEQATKSPERNGLLPSSGFDTSSDLKSDSLDEVHLNVS